MLQKLWVDENRKNAAINNTDIPIVRNGRAKGGSPVFSLKFYVKS